MAAPPASLQRRLCQQYLLHGAPLISISARPPASSILPMALRCSAPASNISARRTSPQHPRYATPAIGISVTAPRPAISQHGAPASNKPHPAEKSTPVWLAIWRIWAGFANSQHRDAAFATPDNICAHSSLLQTLSSCSDIANLSAHLHRLPTPPPYLRQMRLLPGRGAGVGCWILLALSRSGGIGWQKF